MISIQDLNKITHCRQEDAKVLYSNKRYDGAVYLCGYAIEIALKKKICDTLKWLGYPDNNHEFSNLLSFKTHKLDVLLRLSGVEDKIKTKFFSEWSVVNTWDPEMRYKTANFIKRKEAKVIIEASKIIIDSL